LLVTDGADARLVAALKAAAAKEGADVAIVAPTISGVDLSDGTHIAADFRINGGPSVLFDSVALVLTADGAAKLCNEATAKDFVSDAFAHLKFVAFNEPATQLFSKAGIAPDEGFIPMSKPEDASTFLAACRKLRLWPREGKVKMAVEPTLDNRNKTSLALEKH
jgi:catalase